LFLDLLDGGSSTATLQATSAAAVDSGGTADFKEVRPYGQKLREKQ
jgi:hypothetical protein